MAMMRSALGAVSRRLSGSSAAPSMMRRRVPEIHHHQAPPPPSLRPAAPWISRPGLAAQPMRTFMSPAAAAAAAARTRRSPNIQGLQYFPVISRGTEGMQLAEQKRFISMDMNAKDSKFIESAKLAVKRVREHFNGPVSPREESILVYSATVCGLAVMTYTYFYIVKGDYSPKPGIAGNNLTSGKNSVKDLDGKACPTCGR